MLLRILLRYCAGYVEVRCTGGFPEKFLCAAMREGLDVFDVRPRAGGMEFCVLAGEYAAAARAAKKCQCRTHILKKHGLRFPLHGVRQRGPLAAGIAVFAAVLLFLGSCVVSVDIAGSSLVSKDALLTALEKNGLAPGMLQSDVQVDSVEQNVLMELPQLAWIAVNLSFGKATVEVTDKQTKPADGVPQMGLYIVAACDAQIKRIDVQSGVAQVRPGDVVTAGQTLVLPEANVLTGSWTGGVSADILAYTAYEKTFFVPRSYTCSILTGAAARHCTLTLLGARIPLDWTKDPFMRSQIGSYKEPFRLFGVELPVALVTQEYSELQTRTVELDERRAQLFLKEEAAAYEKDALAACRILSRETLFEPTTTGWQYTVRCLCEERIENYIQIE
ncbi:MAG: sporulation protein YqfD [Oscillospiraceae bacterium]|nr:sporulation protein YqfD [Oscillospiraceae bacterium]